MLLFTIPHSGEKIPEMAPWLKSLEPQVLMCDVDRYVDQLYEKTLSEFKIPFVKTEWHRYAADLNRIPEDVDANSVVGSVNPKGAQDRGFHWVKTTHGESILGTPMSFQNHQQLVELIYKPFHLSIENISKNLIKTYGVIYHIDVHSMPGRGTAMHRDPGEDRADIVISDQLQKSCSPQFRDLVIAAYVTAGFKVGYNWPYLGGRVTEQYGNPKKNHHTLQVELNRKLYMDEESKEKLTTFPKVQAQLKQAVEYITMGLDAMNSQSENKK
ncbi:MAG TPA: N-formylglutamate amidohydrolase [Pseudobdellovibrionaceae bacterium]|nr:N-formylglutamate amidohydrolase [Pseudobdellovibrionaceae bacterium]